jgi:hypothetical protein
MVVYVDMDTNGTALLASHDISSSESEMKSLLLLQEVNSGLSTKLEKC